MYNLARQLLFKFTPETSHELSLDLIGAGGRLGLNTMLNKSPASLPVRVMGLDFPNPVGLAAGLDKLEIQQEIVVAQEVVAVIPMPVHLLLVVLGILRL